MTRKLDASFQGYVVSMKLHNRLLSFVGVIFQWLGGFYTYAVHGWQYLLPYIVLVFIFTYFIGIPATINILRCAKAYAGRTSHLVISLLMQFMAIGALVFILRLVGMQEMTSFFIMLGVARAFAMPRDQLMRERVELNTTHSQRKDRDMIKRD
jgi:hypothetical protein